MRAHAHERTAGTFAEWLGTPIVRVSLARRHGQWYAVAKDLSIVGIGETEDEASRDVAGLVEAYLRSCFLEGVSYRTAVGRRVGRVRPRAPRMVYRLVRERVASVLPARRDRTVVLPIGLGGAGSAP